MEIWYLVDELDGNTVILDQCYASSKGIAQSRFDTEGWVVGEVISEADYIHEQQLNALESQSLK